MKVVEIFDSIQGEGYHMGVMCTFVRFAGCNLSCSFCDEAKKYSKAKEMTIEQIVKKCNQQIVVLTGGEPTIQLGLEELVSALHRVGYSVHIETNGINDVINNMSKNEKLIELITKLYNELGSEVDYSSLISIN